MKASVIYFGRGTWDYHSLAWLHTICMQAQNNFELCHQMNRLCYQYVSYEPKFTGSPFIKKKGLHVHLVGLFICINCQVMNQSILRFICHVRSSIKIICHVLLECAAFIHCNLQLLHTKKRRRVDLFHDHWTASASVSNPTSSRATGCGKKYY